MRTGRDQIADADRRIGQRIFAVHVQVDETGWHEIREFNVRVVLVEPTFTNTKLDVNAAQTEAPLGAYAAQADATIKTVQAQIKTAPSPVKVAEKILAAINGPYKMRQPAGGQATLLSRLRRFMGIPRLNTRRRCRC